MYAHAQLAMKFEEFKHLNVSALLRLFHYHSPAHRDGSAEAIAMEVDVFWSMNGYLGYATVFSFLCRFVRAGRALKRVVQVACYVADRPLSL